MKGFVRLVLTTLALTVLGTGIANAQATRTWVSGVGDDANPCSRTAPCKTFAGAISKTAAGGEISVLDPGGFGALNITKGITISGQGPTTSILSSGTNGIIVNAGVNDVVVIRNLSINGAGVGTNNVSGTNGIRYLAGAALFVENVQMTGFVQSGVEVNVSTSGKVLISNSSITNALNGVRVASGASGRVDVALNNVSISRVTYGIDAASSYVSVSHSYFTLAAGVAVLSRANAKVNVENSTLSGNAVAVQMQPNNTSVIRLSNNGIYDNLVDYQCGGGTLLSAGNNRTAGNGGGGACTPSGTPLTLQ